MEKLHFTLLKGANWILASVLALLGFSCGDGGMATEYGSPYANFEVKGKVKDTKGNPIPNAQIRIHNIDQEKHWYYSDTVYSSASGEFIWKKTDFPFQNFKFITEDMDDDSNGGQFAADTTIVTFDSKDFVGGERWFSGTASKVTDIIMKPYIDTHTEPYRLYTIYGKVTGQDGTPLPGILILTDPAYTKNKEGDPFTYPAITDISGRYRFIYDKATATKHTVYTKAFNGVWHEPDSCLPDSVVVDFSEIELTGGKGMLIGKGSKEVNFTLKRTY